MVPDGASALMAVSTSNQYVDIDTFEIVDIPKRPTDEYEFDYHSKEWLMNFDLASSIARRKRNALLVEADYRINTIEDNGGDAKDWRAYRVALRNIPEQDGFPYDIIWPIEPSGEVQDGMV